MLLLQKIAELVYALFLANVQVVICHLDVPTILLQHLCFLELFIFVQCLDSRGASLGGSSGEVNQ